MKFEGLTGGAAVGAAIAVWVTHGDASWSPEEILALAAGIGAVVTTTFRVAERSIAFWLPLKKETENNE